LLVELDQTIGAAKLVSDQPPFFLIQKINLTPHGEKRRSANGGLEFTIPIFKVGANLNAKEVGLTSETLELELAPPAKTIVGGRQTIDFAQMVQTLKNTFKPDVAIRPLTIKYSQRWALQLEAKAGGNVIVVKVGGDIAQENSQGDCFLYVRDAEPTRLHRVMRCQSLTFSV
jgi:hypothetical protein